MSTRLSKEFMSPLHAPHHLLQVWNVLVSFTVRLASGDAGALESLTSASYPANPTGISPKHTHRLTKRVFLKWMIYRRCAITELDCTPWTGSLAL